MGDVIYTDRFNTRRAVIESAVIKNAEIENTAKLNIKNVESLTIDESADVRQVKNYTKVINDGTYLTDGQRKELLKLADKLAEYELETNKYGKRIPEEKVVTESQRKYNQSIVSRAFAFCRSLIKDNAISSGKDGATSIGTVLSCDFEHIKRLLNDKLKNIRNSDGAENHDEWRKATIIAIQTRRRSNLKITDDKFDEYVLAEFDSESISTISNDELKRLKSYTFSKNPSFISKRKDNSVKAKRNEVYRGWVEHKKATDPSFSLEEKKLYKFEIFAALDALRPDLFSIDPDTFELWWKNNDGIKEIKCKVKSGQPPKHLSEKFARYIKK